MSESNKEVENQILEAGERLIDPPSSVDELLSLLDKLFVCLSEVKQSPPDSMQNALSPVMKALVAGKLFKHSDVDVKVAVAACISEITRITDPDAPYDDEQMREVFKLIVSSFENLDDNSSRSYSKRTSILETVAKLRSCVVMLDLECDAILIEMFQDFLKAIRDHHSRKVFTSMENIMTLVLEESKDIPPEMLSPILQYVRKDDEVPQVSRRLAEQVLSNCASKLETYLTEAVKFSGVFLDKYSEIVASICEGSFSDLQHDQLDATAKEGSQGHLTKEAEVEQDKQRAAEVSTPERTDAPKDDSFVDTESSKKQNDTNVKDEPQQVHNPSNTDLDNTPEGKPDVENQIMEKEPNSVKQAETPKTSDNNEEAEPGTLLDSKDVLSSPPDDSSVNAAVSYENENKVGVKALPSKTSADGTVNVSSSSRAEDLVEESRPKKTASQKKKESSTKEAKPSAASAMKEGFEGPNTSDAKLTKKSGKMVASSSKTKSTVTPSKKNTFETKTAKQSEQNTVEGGNVQESSKPEEEKKTCELETAAAIVDKDWELATHKQREEVLAAKALADDLDLCFELQMQEAITVSNMGSNAGDFYGEADEINYTDLLLDDLKRLDLESKDRLLAQQMMNDAKHDLHLILSDKNLANLMQNDKSPIKKGHGRERRRNTIGESSTSSHTFRLYSKGLVSEGLIKDDERQFGGFGVSICDSYDNPLLEMKNPLGDELLAHPEAAELAAIIHGLKWALALDLGKVTFFCDDSNILEYVTGKSESNEPAVATLVEELALLQRRFSSCQASPVRKDITSVVKLAKDAIALQNRWIQDGIEFETCPICYEEVQPHEKFEVPRCYHRICITCMKKHVTETLSRWILAKCPCKDCGIEIPIEDCEGIADPNQIAVMILRKKEETINVADRVYCPNPSCSFLMSKRLLLMQTKSTFLDAAETGARKCIKCGFCFCIDCETKWHYNLSCAEFRKTKPYKASDRATFEAAAERYGWKTCKVCSTWVELADGCKHMTCSRCKHEFCYTCGAEWVKKKATCKCQFRV